MPDVAGRRRAVSVALVVATLLVSIVPAVTRSATPPPGLERFLDALGEVESGGSYTARNATSGAYGKYQIIPASWAAWAKLYLGSSTAPQTPANQETVAHRKVTALFLAAMSLRCEATKGQKALSPTASSLVFPVIYLGRRRADVSSMASNFTPSLRFCCCRG